MSSVISIDAPATASISSSESGAASRIRAEAARLHAPHPVSGLAGSELALLSSGNVTAAAASKPYQVESRIDAARAAAPDAQLRLWLEALAIAKAIAHKSGQRLDYNRQCLAEGLGNLVGAFFQCMPGGYLPGETARGVVRVICSNAKHRQRQG